jgi:GTP-binding protein
MRIEDLRNIAMIAHVDHGKTTLVDQMLRQSGMFRKAYLDSLAGGQLGLIMDSDPIERERGITILSKNCAIYYVPKNEDGRRYKINIIDTPGHADFGGEVERVLRMADGVILLVDAFEGPMPQTRFVLQKALGHGLLPIIVINKVDRPDSRPTEVVDEVFELFFSLGTDESILNTPVFFASALEGWAVRDLTHKREDLQEFFDAVIQYVPGPNIRPADPLQILVTNIEYSEYIGRIAIGRVDAGVIKRDETVTVISRTGQMKKQCVTGLFSFHGLGRERTDSVEAGDLCAVAGLDPIEIGDTIADSENPSPLPSIAVDEPTLHITFRVNNGPFAGREGRYVTSRQIRERLERELRSNVALRVLPGSTTDEFRVSGRGLLHLGILLENMRREGYELCAGKPAVILKEMNGAICEPVEQLAIICPVECQSAVMQLLGTRRSILLKTDNKTSAGILYMEFRIPSRGLIGLSGRMMNATRGRAIMHHSFLEYAPMCGPMQGRRNGVLIATSTGAVTSFALDALSNRGEFMVRTGDMVYEGQIVGENNKDKDLRVNVVKAKKLTNVRSSTKEATVTVHAMREMSLEAMLEYIQEDELVEITPKTLRMRKRILKDSDKKLANRRRKEEENARQ